MSFSLYAATVPVYLQILQSLAGLLDKAEGHCRAHGLPDIDLSDARLTADMWPFSKQIRACWQHSVDAIEGVMSGEYRHDAAEPPQDFSALRARVEGAIEQLRTVRPEAVDALVGRDVRYLSSTHQLHFVAEDFLTSFALPNFFFHASMAYAILRVQGLPLAKIDYLGAIRMKG